MNLNSSNGENERATDSQTRAVRLLPVQAPERPVEGRETIAALTEQLAAARSDAARLVDLLAEAYALHARKSVDAEQRREELAVALKDIERLQHEASDLRASAHELKKQHGALTSDVATLTGDLTAAIRTRATLEVELAGMQQRLAESIEAAGKQAQLLAAERTKSAAAERKAAKFQSAVSRGRRALSLARRTWEDRERAYNAKIDALSCEIVSESNASRDNAAALKQHIESSDKSAAALKREIERLRSAEKDARDEAQTLMQRFVAFIQEAAEERRAQAQLLSELIDEAQKGFAWRIKRFLRNPWRK